MSHAYYVSGELEQGIKAAVTFVEGEFGQSYENNPNILVLRHGLLSVEDARKLRTLADFAPVQGNRKALIISAGRMFHEAQNALLKLFEEPPAGTLLILALPSEGMLLPTLRSRLQQLPHLRHEVDLQVVAFIKATSAEREKFISKLLDKTKSDKEEDKQAARLAALQLIEGLAFVTHATWLSESNTTKKQYLLTFLSDLNRFIPILHERSAPLKLIFEHVLLTLPDLPKHKAGV
jgi:hypothetical protein